MKNQTAAALRTALITVLGAVVLTIANAAHAQPQSFVVGQVVDNSAFGLEASRDFVAGAKIWFDHVNKQGGINGMRIVHRIRDGQGDPGQSVRVARELIEQDGAEVLFGAIGDVPSAAIAGSDLLTRFDVVLFAPETGRWSSAPNGQVRLARPAYEAEVRRSIDHFRKLGLTRFAIVQSDAGVGAEIASAARRELDAVGIHDAPMLMLKETASGVDPALVTALQRAGPQAVIVAAESISTANLVRSFAPENAGVMIIGTSAVNAKTVADLSGAFAKNVVISQVVPDPTSGKFGVTRDHAKLMDTYLAEPPTHGTLAGFIAAKVLTESLRTAGHAPTHAQISDALRKIRSVDVGDYVVAIGSRTAAVSAATVDLTLLLADGRLRH